MLVQDVTCPSESVLSDFGLGKLDEASAERVSRHIETCAGCRQRVASLSGDSFVGRLLQADGARQGGGPRQRAYVPGESLANAASSTDGSSAREHGLPRPSGTEDGWGRRSHIQQGPGSPSSVSAPPELANHADYELIKELGRGGMGTVYLARHRMMDRLEVLKVISKSLLDRHGALERFQQEIRAAAKLAHPNIVAAYSALRPGELLVFAMEYVRGQDLSEVVKQRGPLPVANAAFYIHQVANGLQHAFEKGMVHRDIKPNNLILAIEGKKHVVKILDFGLAKATSEKGAETGLTKSGQMLGTPDYVAPEQTLDAHKADIRADIYSLGCTLYFLLSGAPPFQEQSLFEILQAHHTRDARPLDLVRPEVPAELAAVVAKMMSKNPEDRCQTPVDVAKELVPFFKPRQSAPFPAGPPTGDGRRQTETETESRIAGLTLTQPIAPAAATPSLAVNPPAVLAVAAERTLDAAKESRVSINTRRRPASVWWSSLPPYLKRTAVLAASAGAVLLLGIVFLLQANNGAIRVEINDPQIEVTIKGTDVVLKQADNGHDVKLAPGEKTLLVERGDFKFETDKLILKKGETVTVTVTLLDGQIEVKQRNQVLGRGELTRPVDPDDQQVAENPPPPAPPGAKTADLANKRFPCEIRDVNSGGWSIERNELVRHADLPEGTILFGDRNWTDYDFFFDAKVVKGWYLRILFRYDDEANFHSYGIGAWNNIRELVDTMEGGKWGDRQFERPLSLAQETWYQIQIRVRGERGRCFLNGASAGEFAMPHLLNGRIGFFVEQNASYCFRNIIVKDSDGKVLLQGLPDLEHASVPSSLATQAAVSPADNELLRNPGCDEPLEAGGIPGWIAVKGEWGRSEKETPPLEGQGYFRPLASSEAELRQDVDVSQFAEPIDAGTQAFRFRGYMRSYPQQPPDTGRIVIEYREGPDTKVLETVDSGPTASVGAWKPFSDLRRAPRGTRLVRVRLISLRVTPDTKDNDGYYDSLSLQAVPAGAAIAAAITPSDSPNGLQVIEARWGYGRNWIDVTDDVRANVRDGRYLATVDSSSFGNEDPLHGYVKNLIIRHSIAGHTRTETFHDGQVVYLAADNPSPLHRSGLTLLEAKYGGGNTWLDVLARLKPLVKDDFLSVKANSVASVGPALGGYYPNVLFVRYALNGRTAYAAASGGEALRIDGRAVARSGEPVDLLKLTDPKRDAIRGDWTRAGDKLITAATEYSVLEIPFSPPADYKLTLVASCKQHGQALTIGVVAGRRQARVVLDGWGKRKSCLEMMDGRSAGNSNPTEHGGTVLLDGQPNVIVCEVCAGRISVDCNGARILNWSGDFDRLSLEPGYRTRDSSHLFLGSWDTKFEISRFDLIAIGTANVEPAENAASSDEPPIDGPPGSSKKTEKDTVDIGCSFRNDTPSEVSFLLGDESYKLASGELQDFRGAFRPIEVPVVRIVQTDGGHTVFTVTNGGKYAFKVNPKTQKIENYYR